MTPSETPTSERPTFKNVLQPVEVQQVVCGDQIVLTEGSEPCTVQETRADAEQIHLELEDGRTVSLKRTEQIRTLYADAIYARDLREGDHLDGGGNVSLIATNIRKEGGRVRFQAHDFDQVNDVDCGEQDFIPLAPL